MASRTGTTLAKVFVVPPMAENPLAWTTATSAPASSNTHDPEKPPITPSAAIPSSESCSSIHQKGGSGSSR